MVILPNNNKGTQFLINKLVISGKTIWLNFSNLTPIKQKFMVNSSPFTRTDSNKNKYFKLVKLKNNLCLLHFITNSEDQNAKHRFSSFIR